MSDHRRTRPEAALAQRTLETGEALREGDLLTEIESDGDARFVRVKRENGALCYAMARFPGSEAPSRLLPDWAPFIPRTECMLNETPSHRVLVYSIASGSPNAMRDVVTRLADRLEDLALLDPESLRHPDGSIDQAKATAYAREAKEHLPPDMLTELEDAFLGRGVDAEPLDRAWDVLRAWFADRGWHMEEREPHSEGYALRFRRFSKGSERYDATAMSLMGVQSIMLSSKQDEGQE